MKPLKLTLMALVLGAIFLVAPGKTFAQMTDDSVDSASAECADATASLGVVSLAAAFLLVPSGVVAFRRRRQG